MVGEYHTGPGNPCHPQKTADISQSFLQIKRNRKFSKAGIASLLNVRSTFHSSAFPIVYLYNHDIPYPSLTSDGIGTKSMQ